MSYHRPRLEDLALTRREMLGRLGGGMAALGLATVMADTGEAAPLAKAIAGGRLVGPLAPKAPPLAAKAKRVIFLFANGGPSHVDTFDPKPSLAKYAGKMLPMENLRTERKTGAALPSPYKFRKFGRSGIEVSEIFSKVGEHIDDIAVIRSMYTEVPNHEPSLMMMNCGDVRLPRPSLGSWVTYGLGTVDQNLPGFIAMVPGGYPIQDSQNWQSAFLPGVYQGTYIDPGKQTIEELIENITNHYTGDREQRRQLDLLQALNQRHLQARQRESALETRIESFELAYRMQKDATDAFDVQREPEAVRAMYGPGVFARQCLMARRLAERGVRFIQLYHGAGQPWDSHDNVEDQGRLARECDQPIAALLTDLKQRGMLDSTLVVWGGEFGRTPVVELPTPGLNAGTVHGRDHNSYGFTVWMAGGGVKGGQAYGATDEFGFAAVEKKVHVHDLHATILRLLGFDHTKLTYRYAGRDFRLTDVSGEIVHALIG
jgi:hypothetical protein